MLAEPVILLLASLLLGVGVFLGVLYGPDPMRRWFARQELGYDRVLRRQLMMDVVPRHAIYLALTGIGIAFLAALLITNNVFIALIAGGLAIFMPTLVIRHLETKRRVELDDQLADGLTTLSASVRAGLNLVQAMALVVKNHRGPIRQEFDTLLREYELGSDLNAAMRSASNRIGSPLYRLTFTAIEMHRRQGGDAGESLDRIAESVREIKKLEGKLDALTAQGRTQANMMAAMPIVFLLILWGIDPDGVGMLFTETSGRLLLLIAAAMIGLAYLWIRRIMGVQL
jgi:tight adherence protein B